MRFALVLGDRQDVGGPGIRHSSSRVVDRQARIIADFGAREALRLVLVKLGIPFSGQVHLGKYWSAEQRHRQQKQKTCKRVPIDILHGHTPGSLVILAPAGRLPLAESRLFSWRSAKGGK